MAALVFVVVYQLAYGLRTVASEVEVWRARAAAVADRSLREDALDALASKRPHLDGAALFATLAPRPGRHLARALIAYEAALEYLDNTNERAAAVGVANGVQLHTALIHAVDIASPDFDHYKHHPWREDSGLLGALVCACRESCSRLASWATVASHVIAEAQSTEVLALNHALSPELRELLLRAWAARQMPLEPHPAWFERAAASTGSLTVHALIAAADDPYLRQADARRVRAVYPWLSFAATMLDSYVDESRDLSDERHSYIGHYPDLPTFANRLASMLNLSLTALAPLPNGRRHVVIAASMVALYLSSDTARHAERRASTRRVVVGCGSLTRRLVPILRAWRIAYQLSDA
jgi:hypothetical protein